MQSDAQQLFEWMDPTFGTHNSPFIHNPHEDWPVFENKLEKAFGASIPLAGRKSTEAKNQFRHSERDSPAEVFRNLLQKPYVTEDQFEFEPVWSEQSSESSQHCRTASLSHSESQQSSSFSTQQHAIEKAASSPVEENISAPQPISNPKPVKRGRGRPRLFPPAISEDNPFNGSATRESHLERNRISAEKCRQKKKKYIAKVTADASTLSSRNKALKDEMTVLREQVLNLKNELLRHAGCGSKTIDKYISQSADGQFAPRSSSIQERGSSQSEGSIISTSLTEELAVPSMVGSLPSEESSDTGNALDEYVSMWILENNGALNEQ